MPPLRHLAFASRRQKIKGQALAEYGLALLLIAALCIAALTTLGDSASTMLSSLSSTFAAISTGG